jgi:hypothetical protein
VSRTVLYFLGGALLCWLPLAAACDVKWHRVKPDTVGAKKESDPREWEHDGLKAAMVTAPIVRDLE